MSHTPLFRRLYKYVSNKRLFPSSGKWKYNEPYPPSTPNAKLLPALPPNVKVTRDPIKFNFKYMKGYDARLFAIAHRVTYLVKYERMELHLHQAVELRGYVERLVVEAMRHGDCHNWTMELANFYLREPQLVHKLFKVLVPRYKDYKTSFTALHLLAPDYEASLDPKISTQSYKQLGVLEFKGNPLPPIIPKVSNNKYLLTNILLDAARKDTEWKEKAISRN